MKGSSQAAVAIGAVGSVVLMLIAGRTTPTFLLVLFVGWVASPFAALAWAHGASARWAEPVRVTLYCVTLVLTPVSLALYSKLIPPPAGSARAAVFVVTPPASWLLIATVLGVAALISRTGRSVGT